jgi:putative membrane protein
MRRTLILAGIAVALVAVSPPFDALADRSLTAHMVQHVLLINGAAVLLGFGLPPASRTPSATVVALAAAVATATLWTWHAPVFYEAAIHHLPLHVLEHVTLLGTATALWWAVWRAPRAGMLALFGSLIPATVLGALMTVSRAPWYSSYPKLADQQMAGIVMWGFAGMVTIIAAVALFYSMLAHASVEAT